MMNEKGSHSIKFTILLLRNSVERLCVGKALREHGVNHSLRLRRGQPFRSLQGQSCPPLDTRLNHNRMLELGRRAIILIDGYVNKDMLPIDMLDGSFKATLIEC
jgi:hypothetical protein